MRKLLTLTLALSAVAFGKATWKPLFDGKTLKGWHIVQKDNSQLWKVGDAATQLGQDSAIAASLYSSTGTPYSMLFSDDSTFDQFTVKYSYRLKAGCSGFFFRSIQDNASNELVQGCQIEAKYEAFQSGGNTYYENHVGAIYCWPKNFWEAETKSSYWVKAAKPADQYQDVILTIKKPYAYVNVNGYQAVGGNSADIAGGAVVEWNYTTPSPYGSTTTPHADKPGRFALQIHNGQKAMEVAFKNIAILEGCGDPTKPGYDGATLPGLPSQPAVYQDNGTCNPTSIGKDGKIDLKPYIGAYKLDDSRASMEIRFPGNHTLDIIDIHGKHVFTGSSAQAHTYGFARPFKAGVYFARLSAGGSISSSTFVVR
jgi:hypothetical protein